MRLGDTIVAQASGAGRSARALIRLSGPGVDAVLREAMGSVPAVGASVQRWRFSVNESDVKGRLETCPTGIAGRSEACPTRIARRELPVLVMRAVGPRSYTGEDSAELLVPGNPDLVSRLIADILSLGDSRGTSMARLAEPGEFSARAYLNGKLGIEQAEGVGALVAARTGEELEAARSLLRGTVGVEYRAWAEELASVLALVEAGVDFSDQEGVVAISTGRLVERLTRLNDEITRFLGGERSSEERAALSVVVLVGRPNAGKSTLFNALIGRRRAVVSAIAGTTRDAIREALDVSRDLPGASAVTLVDVAGVDDSLHDSVAGRAAQATACDTIRGCDAALYCDPTGMFEPLDVLAGVRSVIRVRTKADLVGPRKHAGPEIGAHNAVAVCALDGWNLATLRRAIADVSGTARAAGVAGLVPRHRRALGAAGANVREALEIVERGSQDPALIAGALRAGLDALGELVGKISPDDVLGRIFSTFCVGK